MALTFHQDRLTCFQMEQGGDMERGFAALQLPFVLLRVLAAVLLAVQLLLSAQASASPRIAVLEFTGPALPPSLLLLLSDQAREGALESLGTGFLVLTRENMAEILSDSGMELSCASGECEVELARNIGADYVVSGSVTMVEGLHFLNLKLHESAKGSLVSSRTSKASRGAELVELARSESVELLLPIAPAKVERTVILASTGQASDSGPPAGGLATQEDLSTAEEELESLAAGPSDRPAEKGDGDWGRPDPAPTWEASGSSGGISSSFPLSCAHGEDRFALVGRCTDGSFSGLAHYGWFYFARTERNFTGLYQFGVFSAYAGGDFNGMFQASLFPKVGGDLTGLQFGFLNQVDGAANGAQFGLVNLAGSLQGFQVGLVNIDKSGEPLLPLRKAGRLTFFVNVGL
jgi:hypothetical protein